MSLRRPFVATGRVDAELSSAAGRLEELREKSDYDARLIAQAEAQHAFETATRFVEAVKATLL